MDAIQAISGMQQSQIGAVVAIKALKLANAQQQSVANLIEDAAQNCEQIQEAGKGEQVDTYA
jgi:hypothetical protein